MATKGTAWLARRSRDLVPALVALAIREWLAADDDIAEREDVPDRELVPVPESVIQNRLVSTGRLGPCERPGSVIQNRPSEHGPSGPCERPVQGYGQNRCGSWITRACQ